MTVSSHQYVFDAVPLLDDCIDKLQATIDQDSCGRHVALHDMKEVLFYSEQQLNSYLTQTLKKESAEPTDAHVRSQHSRDAKPCIHTTLKALRQVLDEKRRQEQVQQRKIQFFNPQDPLPTYPTQHSMYTSRSATDTLLFRLIVALQLCLVRIDDAHFVITGRRLDIDENRENLKRYSRQLKMAVGLGCISLLGIGMATMSWQQRDRIEHDRLPQRLRRPKGSAVWFRAICYGGATLWVGRWTKVEWNRLWMTDKILKSTNEIEEWIRQWQMVQTTVSPRSRREQLQREHLQLRQKQQQKQQQEQQPHQSELLDDKSRRLIEYAMQNSPKSYFWQSQGEIRFMMLKRFMDVYYASVGTAIDSTTSPNSATWQVPLMMGAAASFYSITGTGASQKASHSINTASRDLIQHAWGLVSLPAIKTLMLQASRLLKGASVADRLEISGVSCFVLTREPAPELAAALKRQHSRNGSQPPRLVNRMSTISETASEDLSPDIDISQRRFAGSCGRYRQRDVILHLTGGGFFAHTIASDLPYLMDWSASTGAVVICPEYALLPEHAFPVALEQIMDVYSTLVDGVDLGFEVNRIIVTGESAGGNLAAALCVRLGLHKTETQELLDQSIESSDDALSTDTIGQELTRMPDALMLSCAALNLSLELSHSRVIGTEDPVLPSGLISAISDAYLPEGLSKHDPLASPFFATDAVLKQFPPVLLFAGSNDPLLDDSVAFNERLRRCGVPSELRAAHNMPHAYWGLGTAGFPEACQVQEECQEWLKRQFQR